MTATIMLGFAVLSGLILIGLRRHRRARLLAMRLPEAMRESLSRDWPLFARLPAEERARLEGLVTLFVAEKTFHGHEGLEVTEGMKHLIAAQACLLIVNKPGRWYRDLATIHLYPGAYRSRMASREGYVVRENEETRAGESWTRGPVVLAWDQTERGAEDSSDGFNVVIHEFAHRLDAQTGVTDGAPLLDKGHDHHRWASDFQTAYDAHTAAVTNGAPTLIDSYGSKNPAEFFAVAVETFFEQSQAFKSEHPALYGHLSAYFRLDPAAWT